VGDPARQFPAFHAALNRNKRSVARARQVHDVEHRELRVERPEHRRNDGEVFGDVVGDRERGQRPTGHQVPGQRSVVEGLSGRAIY